MATSVGFIGVGNMGNPMAGNVLKAGFPFTVFDRNPAAMSNLVSAGARKAASAQEVVEQSAVVLTCLPASPDVEALYLEAGGLVERFEEKPHGDGTWINGGFFVLENKTLDYIDGDKTVWEREPLERLAAEKQLSAYKHDGFWLAMDTLRDKNHLEELWSSGDAPWKIW